MGKRRKHVPQASMWVVTTDLPRSAAHPFSTRLNHILDSHDFDGYLEELARQFYADEGRPVISRSGTSKPIEADGPGRRRPAAFAACTSAITRTSASERGRPIFALPFSSFGAAFFGVVVRDNGLAWICEASSTARRRTGHWGLAGMQERAHNLGATLKISNSSDGGTHIALSIPAAFGLPARRTALVAGRLQPLLARSPTNDRRLSRPDRGRRAYGYTLGACAGRDAVVSSPRTADARLRVSDCRFQNRTRR